MFPKYYEDVKALAQKREILLMHSLSKIAKLSKIKPNF